MQSKSPHELDAKNRVRQLFEYLIEYSRVKNPPRIHLQQYEWQLSLTTLPDHPGVVLRQQVEEPGEEEALLKVSRPILTPCPSLPEPLVKWVASGWDKYENSEALCRESMNLIDDRGETITVAFEDSADRVSAWSIWSQQRAAWRKAEAPARTTQELFNRLFALRSTLDRDGEKFALTLGQGILRWTTTEGQEIEHPLLMRRCSLNFDPDKPEFSIAYEESPPELLAAILREAHEADISGVTGLLEQLRSQSLDPLSTDAFAFLRGLATRIWKDGDFSESKAARTNRPLVSNEPLLLLAPRGRDFAEAAQGLLRNLENFEIPTSLYQVVGLEPFSQVERPQSQSGLIVGTASEGLLFTMPSNPEQERVASRLDLHGCVLVQGPPGTGKTHTIANLIGHLLAQGKNILVTSHTSKALRVVRDKVVPELRGLCVSVLDDERSSQKQLESAVKSMADRMTQSDRDTLTREAQSLLRQRSELEELLQKSQQRLQEVHRGEYDELLVGGRGTPPSQAARKLADGVGLHDWLPGPVSQGAACPLTEQEFQELYSLQSEVKPEDERDLDLGVPDSQQLPDASTFSLMCQRLQEIQAQGTDFGAHYWSKDQQSLRELEEALACCQSALLPITTEEPWLLECLQAGQSQGESELWKDLLNTVESTVAQVPSLRSLVLKRRPITSALDFCLREQLAVCQEIINKLKLSKSLGWWDRLAKPSWKKFLQASRVAGETPKTVEDFEALQAGLQLQQLRQELLERWNAQLLPLKGPALPEAEPERTASEFAITLRLSLSWYNSHWRPLHAQLERMGLCWERLVAEVAPEAGTHAKILRLRKAISQPMMQALEARRNFLLHRETKEATSTAVGYCEGLTSELAQLCKQALHSLSFQDYQRHWDRLIDLERISQQAQRRQSLIDRLRQSAPIWADALRTRSFPHQGPAVPGSLLDAWDFRQWTEQIQERHRTNLDTLQMECATLRQKLQQVTARYVEALTWKFQVERTGTAQRQALLGWLQTQARIGKGTGKTVHLLRRDLRDKMAECRTAVPVWIMPLNRVIEAYRPGEAKFDVVIVDEASQADVTGLIAMTLGREIVVVGDHEQVSPSAVGERVEEVYELANRHLAGIPNRQLFDGKSSVYDIAQRAFGETIRLREHFRCVPEIIAFSNALCYDGDIQPLRESEDTILPATVAHRVQGSQRSGKDINEKEALEVATLIASCIEQPEYSGKTFGVISLVGDGQALYVEKLLREHLDARVLDARRILCGNPAQFQGDERDVIFLSMIDVPSSGGPLRLAGHDVKMYRQRYNVAASRARDQMWVVHSLSPGNDLKPEDIRFKLLKHAEESSKPEAELDRLKQKAESPFEERVMERLVKAGYQVVPQLPIGAYRIDMVVVGSERRVAIECDGDRFHPPENLEQDLKRQQILERVGGLTFIRIRGSAFFLNQQAEMDRVFRRLEELSVDKLGQSTKTSRQESGLRDRVVRRAQQLALQWTSPDSGVYSAAQTEMPDQGVPPTVSPTVVTPAAAAASDVPGQTQATLTPSPPPVPGASASPSQPQALELDPPIAASTLVEDPSKTVPQARPHASWKIEELEALLDGANLEILHRLKQELAFRNTSGAKRLASEVESLLNCLEF